MHSKTPSFKKLTIKASAWTISEFAFTQIVRFGSNLFLTRLLLPEMFGLMQLVIIFTFGLNLLSDLGVGANIIRHPKGDDASFLRTAWSFQAIRGIILWLIGLSLAIPFANFYQYDELKTIIPVACFSTVFTGFVSTNIFVHQKHLQLRIVTLIKITASFISSIVMLSIAWYYQSIWALVSFTLVNSGIILLLSHLVPGVKMKFYYDKKILYEIIHFGKWIILSSILVFLISTLDKLYLGKTVSADRLGFYGIASAFTLAVMQLIKQFRFAVLLPLYRKLLDGSIVNMRRKIRKIRITTLNCLLPLLFILVIWGQEICDWVYPATFSEVGYIVKILAFGTSASIIPTTIGPINLASGNSFRPNILFGSRILMQLFLMYFGNMYFGFEGILYGIAFSEASIYPITVLCIYKYGIWMPFLDFGYLTVCVIVGKIGGLF
jgi:O-antigen/teichoic acid export membrane protein